MKLPLEKYDVIIGESSKEIQSFLLSRSYSKIFVLVDENTQEHCLPLLKTLPENSVIISIQSGEEHKNLTTCQQIWGKMMEEKADRKALLINLGGGVIGDMGGFSASTFKRGIDFIQVPTTLLSQVDASIGGKLGIDFQGVKNNIGLFKDPQQVIIDAHFLETLAKREIVSGFAEMLKHALIHDKEHWQALTQIDPTENIPSKLLLTSLKVKKHVVTEDPFEQGLRKILNWGHSLGHAVESYSLANDEKPLLHGEAIGIGMIMELYLSVLKLGFSDEKMNSIVAYLMSIYPTYPIPEKAIAPIVNYLENDKKNANGSLLFTLLEDIGKAKYDCCITKEEAKKAITYYNSLIKH